MPDKIQGNVSKYPGGARPVLGPPPSPPRSKSRGGGAAQLPPRFAALSSLSGARIPRRGREPGGTPPTRQPHKRRLRLRLPVRRPWRRRPVGRNIYGDATVSGPLAAPPVDNTPLPLPAPNPRPCWSKGLPPSNALDNSLGIRLKHNFYRNHCA